MRDFLRRHVLHNLGAKLVSLALAVGLWLVVSRDPVAEVGVEVPIEFHHIPDNLEISSENIPRAQIRVRGPERIIHRLQTSDVHAEVDLGSVKPGERTFDLTDQEIRKPHDLDVVQIIPSQFQLSFDTRLTRNVPIHPRVTGNFAQGYRIARIVSDPESVTVSGPKSRVAGVEAAITDPVNVSGTVDRASFVTHAYVPDPLVQVIHPQPVRITVIMEKATQPGGTSETTSE
jgi:YbbR domain-containing protein